MQRGRTYHYKLLIVAYLYLVRHINLLIVLLAITDRACFASQVLSVASYLPENLVHLVDTKPSGFVDEEKCIDWKVKSAKCHNNLTTKSMHLLDARTSMPAKKRYTPYPMDVYIDGRAFVTINVCSHTDIAAHGPATARTEVGKISEEMIQGRLEEKTD
jgi:hypothetical protein